MKPKTKLLTLILSFEEGQHGLIQSKGQNPTFIESASTATLILRYVGRIESVSFFLRVFLNITRWLYALLAYSKHWPIGPILRYVVNTRLVDTVILSNLRRNQREAITERFEEPIGRYAVKTIVTPFPEDWSLIGLKTIAALKYVLKNYDFDYLFRTNTSSYVDTKQLLKFVEQQPKNRIYGGVVGNVFKDTRFASGAGVLMSRDVVERICERENEWKHGYVDDVALAEVVSKLNEPQVPLVALPRVDLPTYEAALQIDPEIIKSNFHFRCKSASPEETIKIMHHIHKVKNVS